jgi:predicted SnoaL-like aldol condensation-catalyzing enzyme
VQRYRKVKARVAALADKKFERLEFVIYNRQGDLVMVHTDQVALSPSSRQDTGREDG